jgi:DNA mismatch endonuclease (patch repair protein)
MLANRATDTTPERAVRSALHRLGLRFRKNFTVRAGSVRTRPDIIFPARRVAVYVDGCFWHCCPLHGTSPRTNSAYWGPKLAANVLRDRRADRALEAHGWQVIRVWEHDDPDDVARSIAEAVRVGGRHGLDAASVPARHETAHGVDRG